MTETPIDYETAFADLNTLHYLFTDYTAYTIPRLNPAQFQTVVDDSTVVVVRSLRTGLHYGCSRTRRTELNGNYTYRYSPFLHVLPKERTVIDWVKA